MPFRRLRLLLLAAVTGASLTSCSSGGSSLAALGGDARPSNGSDAAFLSSITEHEKASLGITRLAQRRALRAELRGMARTMTSEQQDELRQLGSLGHGVVSRGARPPATSRPPSSALVDLARVKDATSFDHEFMRTMIEQNQRAIAIARHEVSYGSDPVVKRLAAVIESSRKDELEQIRAWLRLWYGDIQPPAPPSPGPPGGGGGGGQKPSPGPSTPGTGPRPPL